MNSTCHLRIVELSEILQNLNEIGRPHETALCCEREFAIPNCKLYQERQRIGADCPYTFGTIREQLGFDLLGQIGISPDLIRSGGTNREAYRRYISQTIVPFAQTVKHEITTKNAPVKLNFNRLLQGDLATRSRAVGQLAKAGVELDRALRLTEFSTSTESA